MVMYIKMKKFTVLDARRQCLAGLNTVEWKIA
jgi:hypothetical protein